MMLTEKRLFQTDYGYFSADGEEYVITRPDTPKPWVNVICPGDYGLVVSQTGGGYSWRTHASLNRITRWDQDLVADDRGKYIYIRDEDTGQFWSATWKPVCRQPEFYQCRHGFGYTQFVSRQHGIETELTLFVPPGEPLEIWQLQLRSLSPRPRRLTLWTYLEWCLGESPDSHREFHRTFIETSQGKPINGLLATKRLWTIPNANGQHWNRSWEFVAWHAVNIPVNAMSGSKEAFLGPYRGFANPLALTQGRYMGCTTGKWDDGIASLCNELTVSGGEAKTVVWTLGTAKSRAEALKLARKYQKGGAAAGALKATKRFWQNILVTSQANTPDTAFNLLANRWLKYQAVSGRIWGRTGYYQSGGAYGYRDQLQDSQIFLQIDPALTRQQILLHAAHQYPEGIVHHWWHPITETGLRSGYSDDLLWLPFVTVNYLKETSDFAILKERAPFLESTETATLHEHCLRAIEHALKRRSKRGLPLIGAGDWNDGLSVVGWEGKGESAWVGMFLCGVLEEFSEAISRAVRAKALPVSELHRARRYQCEAGKLRVAVNRHTWDGRWYWAASCDDGSLVGSRTSREGNIHLNPQTWAVVNRIVPRSRLDTLLHSVEDYLYRDYGALVLSPAYQNVDERVGYLTRYAPGVRENGGTYTHAATWAIQMECVLKRSERAWELFKRISPPDRGLKPDLYAVEPYVTPGNVDGPDSPYYGRGGWTWYTGSAAWLYRVMTEWILGVRPDWDGLRIDPCVPEAWNEFTCSRQFRGATYRLHFVRNGALDPGSVVVSREGHALADNVLPCIPRGTTVGFEVEFNG